MLQSNLSDAQPLPGSTPIQGLLAWNRTGARKAKPAWRALRQQTSAQEAGDSVGAVCSDVESSIFLAAAEVIADCVKPSKKVEGSGYPSAKLSQNLQSPAPSYRSTLSTASTCDGASDREFGNSIASSSSSVAGNRNQAICLDSLAAKQWLAVFHRLAVDGEIHRDKVHRALEQLDYAPKDAASVDVVLARITQFSTLDADEFLHFLRGFEKLEETECLKLFRQHDVDNSGTIDKEELSALLTGFGITPMAQVLHELVVEAGNSSNLALSFDQFRQVMKTLRVSEGFSRSDMDSFNAAFDHFAQQQNSALDFGDLRVQDLMPALHWLGKRAVESSEVEAMASAVDFDGSGSISRNEFFALMRQLREREVAVVLELVGETAADVNAPTVDRISELSRVVAACGYRPEGEVLREVSDTSTPP